MFQGIRGILNDMKLAENNTVLHRGRAVTKALIGGGGGHGYSYIRVLPDEFLLKSVVIKIYNSHFNTNGMSIEAFNKDI